MPSSDQEKEKKSRVFARPTQGTYGKMIIKTVHGSSIEFLTTIRPLISFHPVLSLFCPLFSFEKIPEFQSGCEKISSVTHRFRLLTPTSTGPGTTPTKDNSACCLLLLSICFWRALWVRVYFAVSALAFRLRPASVDP